MGMHRFLPPLLFLALTLLPANGFARELFIATLYAPPIGYIENGKTTGYGVDLVKEALKRAGHKATVAIVPWKRGLMMTRTGEIDGLFYTVRNDEREKWFHFPDEYLIMETTVMVKRIDDNIDISPDHFNYSGLSLGIGRGYYYGPKLKAFLEQARFLKIEEANTIDLNLKKLLEGRIDMFLADAVSIAHFLKDGSKSDMAEVVADAQGEPIVFDSVKSYLAFSRKTTTRNEVRRFSEALRLMKEDGTYNRIINEYRQPKQIRPPLPHDTSNQTPTFTGN